MKVALLELFFWACLAADVVLGAWLLSRIRRRPAHPRQDRALTRFNPYPEDLQ